VILINLLPHREAARKLRRDVFNVSLGLAALLGGLVAGAIFLWYQTEISDQQNSNSILKTEITKLEGQIKDIAGLETEIAALKARQQAVEDLQSDRNLPVHLLTELVQQLPDGVFIGKMVQADQSVTISGTAQSNDRVSELLRNLGNNTPWFAKPELIEIVAGSLTLPTKEQKRVSNFVIKVRLVRATEAEKAIAPAALASAPIAAGSAPARPASAPAIAASLPVKQ
jgi:type IV pilus assembly protein PilN